jgi:hypothetical protein
LYGHALAAGCLAFALFLAHGVAGERGGRTWQAFAVGLLASWSVVTEFPAAPPAALIAAFAVWRTRRLAQRWRTWGALAAGGALGAVVLLGYNGVAFGNPWHLAYSSETAGYEAMHQGIFGVTWPDLRVAIALLVGRYRGLLPLAPILLLAPIGWWMLARRAETRLTVLVAAAVALYYLLMAAGYAYWDGGWSYASRHVGPALPFVGLGLAPVWQRGRGFVRALVLALMVIRVGQTLVAVATTPQPPGLAADDPLRLAIVPPKGSGAANPMPELLWPAFRSGDFPIGWQSILEKRAPSEPLSELERRGVPRASWNAGQRLFGLNGHASLLPLVAVWALCAVAWRGVSKSANMKTMKQ